MNINEAKEVASRDQQDYQGLQAQVRAAQLQRKAAKWERLPTLDFQGNYGVTGVAEAFAMERSAPQGWLEPELFAEAVPATVASRQPTFTSLIQQLAALNEQINQQLDARVLDVQTATKELVRVAQSNVELARKELEQTTDRF